MAYNPNNPNGQATSANSAPVVLASDQSPIAVSLTGVATAANQTNAAQKTQIVDGSGNVLGTTLVGGLQRLNVSLAAGSVPGTAVPAFTDIVGGKDSAGNSQQLSVDTTGKVNINNISGVVSLPTGASTEATLAIISGKTPALGQTTSAASSPVVIANDQTPLNISLADLYVIGQSAQTATVNNILTAAAGVAATDLATYRSALVQVVSTGTAGTYGFEGSNDNINFQAIPVYSQLISTGTVITTAITATVSQLGYVFPLQFRYHRLRIVTAITGGSIQAFSRFSSSAWTPAFSQVVQNTGTSLNTVDSGNLTTVSALTTVASITSDNLAAPGLFSDNGSSTITISTTSGTLTPTNGPNYVVQIPVTAVSGTAPTLDVEIQESDDGGTNWYAVYDFPRITAVGVYRSPVLYLTGNRMRYVQTISGTTPSFTRALNRLQMSSAMSMPYRQLIDRTIVLTTAGSVTPVLTTSGAKNFQITVNIGAATTAPAVELQVSDDAGATFYKIGTPLATIANSTVSQTVPATSGQLVQAVVTTAGVGVVIGYVLVRAF